MTSRRERLRSLFGHGRSTTQGSSKSPTHPPRTSDTRHYNTAGLARKSPSLRPTPEQDVLQDDLPDDIEFLSLDNTHYDEPEAYDDEDELDTIDEDEATDGSRPSSSRGSSSRGSSSGTAEDLDDDSDDMKDWPEDAGVADKAVHLDNVPRSDVRLQARQYKQPQFAVDLLHLLRHDLKARGWAELGQSATPEQVSIHKVSGSLTNAVFFISYPQNDQSSFFDNHTGDPPPTVLLRIYGPSSGNLISRKKELHVLNTLSACYGIGPAILGTFANGRVEEYFESRALYKEEMRIPRVSRWIARRMRELHSVDLNLVELPPEHPKSPFFGPAKRLSSDSYHRPGMHNLDSGLSALSTSSASSIRSFTSTHSEGSASPTYPASPMLNARRSSKPGVSEGAAPRKKRSMSTLSARSDFSLDGEKANKPKSVVWQNIDSWTKEARKVLKKVDKLEEIIRDFRSKSVDGTPREFLEDVNPLNAPSLLVECRRLLDLHAFQNEVKRYRHFIQSREGQFGRSKRVFAHNDAQCGNLLRLTPNGTDDMLPGIRFPHEMIIVVDFEYAGVNPRGFDIANHFLEWRTDYHHETLSHSLTRHGDEPTIEERQRFYRAYIPCDGAFDTGHEPAIPPLAEDDPRVQRLEEEVQLWMPASHAMYTVWSIVQATNDIVTRIEEWLDDPLKAEEAERKVQEHTANLRATRHTPTRPNITRGKSGEEIHMTKDSSAGNDAQAACTGLTAAGPPALPAIGDFDYMSYSLERVRLFRENIKALGV